MLKSGRPELFVGILGREQEEEPARARAGRRGVLVAVVRVKGRTGHILVGKRGRVEGRVENVESFR